MLKSLFSIAESIVKVAEIPLVIVDELVAKPIKYIAESLTDTIKGE